MMSCNDCKKAAALMHTVLDGEASQTELKEFETHLNNCLKCSSHYDEEKNLFKAIKSKLEQKCCPDKVLSDILSKIKELVK